MKQHDADWERGAFHQDEDHRNKVLAWLEENPSSFEVYPFGMEGDSLWGPYKTARDKVELYPEGPQLEGLRLDWVSWDAAKKELRAGLLHPSIPSRCPRFAARECPLLAPMGHEPTHSECNYWAYPRFEEFAPKIELYPEWQRFDCHRYYQLFQATLVLGELAANLNAQWKLDIITITEEKKGRMIAEYAALCAAPENFVWHQV